MLPRGRARERRRRRRERAAAAASIQRRSSVSLSNLIREDTFTFTQERGKVLCVASAAQVLCSRRNIQTRDPTMPRDAQSYADANSNLPISLETATL